MNSRRNFLTGAGAITTAVAAVANGEDLDEAIGAINNQASGA